MFFYVDLNGDLQEKQEATFINNLLLVNVLLQKKKGNISSLFWYNKTILNRYIQRLYYLKLFFILLSSSNHSTNTFG